MKSRISMIIAIFIVLASVQAFGDLKDAVNSVEVFRVASYGNTIWAGWNYGIMHSINIGTTWNRYDTANGFPGWEVGSMIVHGDDFWAGLYYDTTTPGGYTYPIIKGLFKGNTQTLDREIIETFEPNYQGYLPYGIAVYNDSIWTANWWKGLLVSADGGHNWDQVTFNSIFQDPDSLHHRIYAVAVDENNVWAGSENGLHHSTDRGGYWEFLRNDEYEPSSITANKIVGLGLRQTAKGTEVWAAAWKPSSTTGQFGVAVSTDVGQTWRATLIGKVARSIYFFDDDIFIPSYSGLWYSNDGGFDFINLTEGQISTAYKQYTITITSDSTIWLATSDGLYQGDYAGLAWSKVDFVALDAEDISNSQPTYFSLGQNYPNPFNPTTKIPVSLKRSDDIQLAVYNILGQKIKTLYSGLLGPGDHNFVWDGSDTQGNQAAGGVYFYRLVENGRTETRSMLLIK
jgi:hypothetical protein